MASQDTREQGTAAAVAIALMLMLIPLITAFTSMPTESSPSVWLRYEAAISESAALLVVGIGILVYFPGPLQQALWKRVSGWLAILFLLGLIPAVVNTVSVTFQLRAMVSGDALDAVMHLVVRALGGYGVEAVVAGMLALEAFRAARIMGDRAKRQGNRPPIVYPQGPRIERQSAAGG